MKPTRIVDAYAARAVIAKYWRQQSYETIARFWGRMTQNKASTIVDAFENGDLFVIDDDVASYVIETSASIPGEAHLQDKSFISQKGVIAFGPVRPSINGEVDIPFLTWFQMEHIGNQGKVIQGPMDDLRLENPDSVILVPWMYNPKKATMPIPVDLPNWNYRTESIGLFALNTEWEVELQLAKLFAGFMEFMSQKIIVLSAPIRPSRSIRRQNQLTHESFYRTVTLRAFQYTGEKQEHQGGTITKRFIVRGHWRNQWYPSTETHRAIWIMPHIKGPEHLRLENPESIFDVSR